MTKKATVDTSKLSKAERLAAERESIKRGFYRAAFFGPIGLVSLFAAACVPDSKTYDLLGALTFLLLTAGSVCLTGAFFAAAESINKCVDRLFPLPADTPEPAEKTRDMSEPS